MHEKPTTASRFLLTWNQGEHPRSMGLGVMGRANQVPATRDRPDVGNTLHGRIVAPFAVTGVAVPDDVTIVQQAAGLLFVSPHGSFLHGRLNRVRSGGLFQHPVLFRLKPLIEVEV